MTVTPEMIARAKRCDCARCKRYLAELEKSWNDRFDVEKIVPAIEKYQTHLADDKR